MTRLDTTEYEFSHGRKPRGKGLWLFRVYWGYYGRTLEFNGKWEDAKKFALQQGRLLRNETVKLLP